MPNSKNGNSKVLTVSEITGVVKQTLESNFGKVSIVGEISNFKAHISGHWYFTLKDENAQISCTMWKGFNNYVYFTPQDGMKIIANGRLTVYPPRGNYQVDVRSMKPAGEGELQAAYEKLKRKLADEGLFDEEIKKPVPLFPRKIGIVTAKDGAAFRDMISVAERRYPMIEIIIAPSKVQGDGAAEEIAANIRALNHYSDVDTIIVGRGGGSLEDLWAFNEEVVAREIFNSNIPIISGVGHEIDFTIADFTADLRAPTPTAAMEMATPNISEIKGYLSDFSFNILAAVKNIMNSANEKVHNYLNSYGFRIPENLIKTNTQLLDNTILRLDSSFNMNISQTKNKLDLFHQILQSHDTKKIMKKGFTLVKQNNNYITRAEKLNISAPVEINFYDKKITINKHGEEKK